MSPRSFHVDGPKTKGAGTNSGESGTRNLEAESIRRGAESARVCVKLKTVTEIRRSSACIWRCEHARFLCARFVCAIYIFSFFHKTPTKREPRKSSYSSYSNSDHKQLNSETRITHTYILYIATPTYTNARTQT